MYNVVPYPTMSQRAPKGLCAPRPVAPRCISDGLMLNTLAVYGSNLAETNQASCAIM